MHEISFPNLGITIDYLPKSLTLFGTVDIAFYGLIIGIGIMLGYFVAKWQAVRTNQNTEVYLDFALYAIITSIIGARVYYVIFSWDYYKDDIIQIFNLRAGGLAIYGAVIGAVLSAIVYTKIKKYSFFLLADTGVAGLITGQILGRWGNFFNREAFGDYTDGLFAMRLSVEDVSRSSITKTMLAEAEKNDYVGFIQVHPTFLYESVWNLVVLVILIVYTKHKKFDGEIFLLYLAGYGLGRAWIEGLRTDQLLIGTTSLAVSQLLSIFLFVSCTAIILYKHYKIKKAERK